MSYSKKEAIQLLRKIADDLGHSPSQPEFEEYTGESWWSVGKQFDGWNALKEAANLDTYQGGHEIVHSKSDIENQIQNATEELGYVPDAHEFNQRSDTCSLDVAQRRFGTWNNAVESAGFNSNRPTYDHNSEYFSSIDSPANAYWLGMLFADGNLSEDRSNVVGLTSVDTNHLKKFRNEVSPRKPLHDLNNGRNVQQFKLSDELMASDLRDHGLNTRTVPDIQRQFRPHFVRGFFDGDGCAVGEIRIYNGNKSLLESIASWVPTDEYRFNAQSRDEGITVHTLAFRKQGAIATVEWMYPDGTDTQPTLQRKKTKANEYAQHKQ